MTRSWAVEWAPYNIRVNAVAPSIIRTPMTEALTSQPDAVAKFEVQSFNPYYGAIRAALTMLNSDCVPLLAILPPARPSPRATVSYGDGVMIMSTTETQQGGGAPPKARRLRRRGGAHLQGPTPVGQLSGACGAKR